MLGALFQHLCDQLPSQCEVCHAWPAAVVCPACVERFRRPQARCQRCAMLTPVGQLLCGACIKAPSPLDSCLAAVSYRYPWSDLIIDFKFQNQPGLASFLSRLLRNTAGVEPALQNATLLIPMPLSSQRLQQRGFNQALVLAHQLANEKTDAGLLLRIQDTKPQSQLKRSERVRNVAGAFTVDPLRLAHVKNQRVVLLDDVMTSGASLFAAAEALRLAGAAHITGLVVARTDVDR